MSHVQNALDVFARIMGELEPQNSWVGFIEEDDRLNGPGDAAALVGVDYSGPVSDNLDSIIDWFSSRRDQDDFQKAA